MSVSLRSQPIRTLILGAVMALTALVAGGCGASEPVVVPDILYSFPAEWTALPVEASSRWQLIKSTALWQTVNIDGDLDQEFLVLYTYDNSSNGATDGPAGALIYDFQDTSEFAVGQPSLPIPLQPSGYFVPYRLLPSYWQGLEGAFVSRSAGSISTIPVLRTSEEEGLLTPTSTGENNELVLVGGSSTLTFIWWRNVFDGYGATQINGPAGFRNINGGATLGSWAESPTVISQADALYPIDSAVRTDGRPAANLTANIGRSLLCYVIHYNREAEESQPSATAGDLYQADISFTASPKGIQFCRSTPPAHPFYPEGVVVKYLYDDDSDRNQLMAPGLEKNQQEAILDATSFDPADEWIADIETRTDIDYSQTFRTTQPPNLPDSVRPTLVETRQLMTQVCVDIQPDVPTTGGSRLLYFSLINEPPSVVDNSTQSSSDENTTTGSVQRATDQLWITNVEDATEWGAADCAELVLLDVNSTLTPTK